MSDAEDESEPEVVTVPVEEFDGIRAFVDVERGLVKGRGSRLSLGGTRRGLGGVTSGVLGDVAEDVGEALDEPVEGTEAFDEIPEDLLKTNLRGNQPERQYDFGEVVVFRRDEEPVGRLSIDGRTGESSETAIVYLLDEVEVSPADLSTYTPRSGYQSTGEWLRSIVDRGSSERPSGYLYRVIQCEALRNGQATPPLDETVVPGEVNDIIEDVLKNSAAETA